ncbi:MAG: alpha-mannosidase [Bacteroidetes bacterium GWD2_45_23]|nr:MAG: alpha-mannosidase [Bacteroidetes bacterium GWC2_46_850]OFX86659.1 MAG: alpha-mannosidase [Bacteroidetes bacterium GWD2_45_23]HBB01920.1 alpha-mannosidase [Porphyromonadaceae bacterium]HCC19565.1 alpha-mannosidase [Porphyromonadaceae bacterium]
MRKIVVIILTIGILTLSCKTGQENLVKYVNTLQGTDSRPDYSYGNTYPTVAVPYPMHAFSPQTGKNGDGWKYQYEATTIRGFQVTHQCSPWVRDYATLSLMPQTGKLTVHEDERATGFSHDHETARPHYYAVQLDNRVNVEIAPVKRGGMMRFTFPENEKAYLVLDGYIGRSSVTIIPEENKIIGWVNSGFLFPQEMKGYFVLSFDQPFLLHGTWENRTSQITPHMLSDEGEGKGAYVAFAEGTTTVQVKIAMSYISPEQAEQTLMQELGNFGKLEEVSKAAGEQWNDLLNRVKVEGESEEDKATFYSCLFRANLFSHTFHEINEKGEPYYRSPYDFEVHDGYMYTDNGFWDTFRSQFPLTNILHPTMQGRYMQSLLDAKEQCGFFPAWSCPGMSGIMIGNHAISLLTDAWAKGIRNFDPEKALEQYYHEITHVSFWKGSSGREGHEYYFERGYIPYEITGESAAKTLEYVYDDWCAYHLAKMTGNKKYEEIFGKLVYHYQNLWDSKTEYMRGRKLNGGWVFEDFNPYRWGNPFTEGNSAQYSWSVFHDMKGLISLMGGEEAFNARLDSFFHGTNEYDKGAYYEVIHEIKEMLAANMGQYAHGNQPCQHVPYLYNFSGEPWKSQAQVRKVMSQLYNASPQGYPGDEDQGGLSSWYVLSAMGIYSVCPGTDQYVLGSPLFKKVTITLEDGKQFVIEAENNSPDNVYIASAELNGLAHTKNWIAYADIVNGGKLKLVMSDAPNKERGTKMEDRPYSVSTEK